MLHTNAMAQPWSGKERMSQKTAAPSLKILQSELLPLLPVPAAGIGGRQGRAWLCSSQAGVYLLSFRLLPRYILTDS